MGPAGMLAAVKLTGCADRQAAAARSDHRASLASSQSPPAAHRAESAASYCESLTVAAQTARAPGTTVLEPAPTRRFQDPRSGLPDTLTAHSTGAGCAGNWL